MKPHNHILFVALLVSLGVPLWASDVKVLEGLVYADHDGVELQLDLAVPEGDADHRPAIVFIHGGGWAAGNRQHYRRMIETVAKVGYVAATVTYRLAPEHTWPAQWEDVKAAVLWLRAHAEEYSVDPSRIGVTGGSAGGHLSLLLGTYLAGEDQGEAKVQAVVNYYGPTELAADEYPEKVRSLIRDFLGGTSGEKPEIYRIASPVTHVSAVDAPVLTFHGTADPLVPVEQARLFHRALDQARVPNEMVLLQDQGHGWRGEERKRTEARMVAFFDRYLKVSDLPLVVAEDFETGPERWEPTDASAWQMGRRGKGAFYSLIKKRSNYKPKVRSPYNIALLKDASVSDFVLDVRLQSTIPDYGHRDLCLFFGYQSPSQFYYVHFGKKADAHANSIFLVNEKPRVSIATERTDGTDWDDHWHRARVVRDTESGRIEVYFDDMTKAAMKTVDKTFLHGRVGIGSFDDTGNFDVIRLWGTKHAE